jgi:hypothetical protein
MKYLGDCEVNNLNQGKYKNTWAYIEDYLFKPDGTLIIIGTGYHTYERCGWVIVSELVK